MPFSARHNRDPWIRGRSDTHLLEELLARFAHRSTLCIRFLLIQLCNGRRVPINVLLHLIDLGLKLLVRLQLALSRRLTQSLNRSIDRPSIAAVSGGCTYTIAHWSELRHLHLGCRGLNVDIISNNTSTRSHEHTSTRSDAHGSRTKKRIRVWNCARSQLLLRRTTTNSPSSESCE